MRRIPVIIILLAFCLYSCKKDDTVVSNNTSTGTNTGGTADYNVDQTMMLQLINDVRQTGCTCGTTPMPAVPALAWNDQLAKAAYDHSVDMETNNYFSHTGLNNSDPGQRITAAGYSWHAYGENIASGYTSEQAVVTGWLQSEDHCRNIMNAGYKDMGVGRDGNYWTQEFGAK
jgi:uncharacterized protein YkwD